MSGEEQHHREGDPGVLADVQHLDGVAENEADPSYLCLRAGQPVRYTNYSAVIRSPFHLPSDLAHRLDQTPDGPRFRPGFAY